MKIFTHTVDWTGSHVPEEVVIEKTEDHWESINYLSVSYCGGNSNINPSISDIMVFTLPCVFLSSLLIFVLVYIVGIFVCDVLVKEFSIHL